MKSNFKKRLIEKQDCSGQVVKRLWEMLALIVLHREFGFGRKRLKRFAEAMNDIYEEFIKRASVSDIYDKKRRELTDIDSAVIRAIIELRSCDIDHRDILGTNERLVMVDENGKSTDLDRLVDKIERGRTL